MKLALFGSAAFGAILSLGAATIGTATGAFAASKGPALIYGQGGKFDKSFNESGYNGAEKFKKETGIEYRDKEPTSATDRTQAVRRFARDGNDPIVVLGFEFEDDVKTVSKQYPKLHFAIIDDVVDSPNVASYVFKEDEGSYLVGLLAGLASKTGTVGFVGGMDVPLIRKFGCGYAQGAKAARPDIKLLQTMTGTTPSAWNDPGRGGELTKNQIAQGADVVYAAAGQTGLGVLQAAADAGKYGIGVDSNQNYLHPGKILTSMVKHVDVAVYDAFTAVHGKTFKPGITVLGLKQNGIEYALDSNNAPLVTADMKAAVEKAKAGIIDGSVKVHDYMSDNSCPAQ